jgi:hypothetical protein
MLKLPFNCVLGSTKSSTCRLRFSECGSARGVFPFAKIHWMGERPHEVWSVPPPVSTRLRPCVKISLSIPKSPSCSPPNRSCTSSRKDSIVLRIGMSQLLF